MIADSEFCQSPPGQPFNWTWTSTLIRCGTMQPMRLFLIAMAIMGFIGLIVAQSIRPVERQPGIWLTEGCGMVSGRERWPSPAGSPFDPTSGLGLAPRAAGFAYRGKLWIAGSEIVDLRSLIVDHGGLAFDIPSPECGGRWEAYLSLDKSATLADALGFAARFHAICDVVVWIRTVDTLPMTVPPLRHRQANATTYVALTPPGWDAFGGVPTRRARPCVTHDG